MNGWKRVSHLLWSIICIILVERFVKVFELVNVNAKNLRATSDCSQPDNVHSRNSPATKDLSTLSHIHGRREVSLEAQLLYLWTQFRVLRGIYRTDDCEWEGFRVGQEWPKQRWHRACIVRCHALAIRKPPSFRFSNLSSSISSLGFFVSLVDWACDLW